jgi:hypothetical protein
MKRLISALALAALATQLTAGQPEGAGAQWTNPGGDAGKTHYSRLSQITPPMLRASALRGWRNWAPRAAWRRRR